MNRHNKYCLPLLYRVVVFGEREARREKIRREGSEVRLTLSWRQPTFILHCSTISNVE